MHYLILDITEDPNTTTIYNHHPMYRGAGPQVPTGTFRDAYKDWEVVRMLPAQSPGNPMTYPVVLARRV